MPLDRRITLRVQGEATRNSFGEDVPGVVTEYPVWAQRRGAGSVDTLTEGGLMVSQSAIFTVRYFEALARTRIVNVTVIDEYGAEWNVENLVESDARRRFIDVSATIMNAEAEG